MRVDRGIDREETAVAAVSERYRGDNVFRVETSLNWYRRDGCSRGSWTWSVDEISCDTILF